MRDRDRSVRRTWIARGIVLIGALIALIAYPTLAAAAPRIERVRVARRADFDRVVLDLSGGFVPAFRASDPPHIDIGADLAGLDPNVRRRLGALGVRVETQATGTRLSLDAKVKTWRVFRLTSGKPRIVLDLGEGAVGVPPDAEPLPEIAPSGGPRVDGGPPEGP